MALDYSARRQVSRNRPKRRPIGRYVLLALVGVSAIYGLGLATGWLLFGRDDKAAPQAAAPSPAAATAKQDAGKAPAGATAAQTGPAATAEGTDLTFFNTLPRGEKSIMGSGMNPRHEAGTAAAGNPPAQTASADRTPQTVKTQTPPASPEQAKAKSANEAKPSSGAEKSSDSRPADRESASYSVQVASYPDRKEAESLKQTLEQKGLSVRISETKVQGKGVRYRVRVGKGLHREGASQLASKLGGSAMVVSE